METTAYDRRWDTLVAPKEKDRQAYSLKEGLIFSGNNSFDVNRLICSEYGQKIIDTMEPFFLSSVALRVFVKMQRDVQNVGADAGPPGRP